MLHFVDYMYPYNKNMIIYNAYATMFAFFAAYQATVAVVGLAEPLKISNAIARTKL